VLDPGRVRAILFDLDGTIADSDDTVVQRLAALLRPFFSLRKIHNERKSARRLVMAADTPLNAFLSFLDRYSLDEWIHPLSNALHHLRGETEIRDARLIPGVAEALDRLAARYPLALVTAREKYGADALQRALQIQAFFRCVATAGTCRRSKPHPAPVLWAADRLGLAPRDCLMVGDTPVDIRAGCAAGTQTVGVLCGFGERDELLRAGADLVLDSTADLPGVLLLERGD
jgi:HAD superfamily hydrolase (TIGR01509 family)